MAQSNDTGLAEVVIPCGGIELAGELTVPANAPGIVVFAHGSGSSRHSPRNQAVAQALHERQLGTLLFDLLTEKEEAEEQDTRHFRFDLGLLAARLIAATAWLHRRNPELRLGFFGSSTGGGAALVAAVQSAIPIMAIVSRGGRPDLAGPALPAVRSPTLLIVGGNDTAVLQLNRAAFAQLACEKKLEIVPGATHLFEEPGALEQVCALAGRWFVEHFAPARP